MVGCVSGKSNNDIKEQKECFVKKKKKNLVYITSYIDDFSNNMY